METRTDPSRYATRSSISAAGRLARTRGISSHVVLPHRRGVVAQAREVAFEMGVEIAIVRIGAETTTIRVTPDSRGLAASAGKAPGAGGRLKRVLRDIVSQLRRGRATSAGARLS